MKPLLIVQTGNPPPDIVRRHGYFEDMFIRLGGVNPTLAQVLYIERDETLTAPTDYSGAIVSGSECMVTDRLPWSEELSLWIREAAAADLPLLGVCYGHQLMAQALGGTVDFHPRGSELGTKTVTMRPASRTDPFLAHLPSSFPAQLSHAQTVMDLPAGAVALAESEHDPSQIIRYSRTALSVQFHPEFSAAVMASYIDLYFSDGVIGYAERASLIADVAETPVAQSVLLNFVVWVMSQRFEPPE